MKNKLILSGLTVFFTLLMSHQLWAHARFVIPTPRNLNAGNKVGPCGAPQPATAMHTFAPGATIPIQITETIDHPGKYFVNFSTANDANFQQYQLAVVPDINGGALPHTYNATVQLPNVTCNNCTLQLIQSMEENPANPSYYYSCADVKLGAPTPTPSPQPAPGTLTGGTGAQQEPQPAWGCGRVSDTNDKGGPPGTSIALMMCFFLPLILLRNLRKLKSVYEN